MNDSIVTCGNCQRSWDESLDPAPSAMCHYCNGKGYTTAPTEDHAFFVVSDDDEVTAVFVDQYEWRDTFGCYAHVGQHSTCSLDWIKEQTPATSDQRSALVAELSQIYDRLNVNPTFPR